MLNSSLNIYHKYSNGSSWKWWESDYQWHLSNTMFTILPILSLQSHIAAFNTYLQLCTIRLFKVYLMSCSMTSPSLSITKCWGSNWKRDFVWECSWNPVFLQSWRTFLPCSVRLKWTVSPLSIAQIIPTAAANCISKQYWVWRSREEGWGFCFGWVCIHPKQNVPSCWWKLTMSSSPNVEHESMVPCCLGTRTWVTRNWPRITFPANNPHVSMLHSVLACAAERNFPIAIIGTVTPGRSSFSTSVACLLFLSSCLSRWSGVRRVDCLALFFLLPPPLQVWWASVLLAPFVALLEEFVFGVVITNDAMALMHDASKMPEMKLMA